MLDPIKTKNMMTGDLPMVETQFAIVFMKHPRRGFYQVPINF